MSERLAAALARLADVLARENAALAALNLRRAGALLQEKRDAAQALADAQAEPVTPAQRTRLAGPADRLRALASENRRLLEHAITVQTRVLGIVARASRVLTPAPGYRATGRLADIRAAPCALSSRA
ncbi:MAG TPA: hypothetical protein VGG99_25015 [Acetobacteraceae bacterium]|jgi:hypothetical protein